MRRLGANALVLGVAVLVSLAAGELAVRTGYGLFANYNLEMWRYAREMKEPLEDGLLPFRHRAGAGGAYYGVHIETNAMGFRDVERPLEKRPGTVRIAVLGDSFTLGWGVPAEETFARRLEKLMNRGGTGRYEVMNMGVGNFNTTMEVELFRRTGLALRPDVVVLVFFANDAEPVPEVGEAGDGLLGNSYLAALVADKALRVKSLAGGTSLLEYYRGLYREGAPGLAANRAAVRRLAGLCRERGMGFLVVSFPDLRELDPYPFGFVTEYIRALAEEEGAAFLDLLPRFAGEKPSGLWVSGEDAHPNARAHGIAARAMYERLAAMLPPVRSEEDVDEGGEGGTLREENEDAQHQEHDEDGQEPELLPDPEKGPELPEDGRAIHGTL